MKRWNHGAWDEWLVGVEGEQDFLCGHAGRDSADADDVLRTIERRR